MGHPPDGRQSRTHGLRLQAADDALCALDEHFFADVLPPCSIEPEDRPQLRRLCLEIKRHPWATMEDSVGYARPGCAACRKPIYTPGQWMEHLQGVAARMSEK
jgi:hypothetical protein